MFIHLQSAYRDVQGETPKKEAGPCRSGLLILAGNLPDYCCRATSQSP